MKRQHTPRLRPEALTELRLARWLSVAEFAYVAGVSVSQIYRWELGQQSPRMETLRRIAAAFDVEIETLLDTKDAAA